MYIVIYREYRDISWVSRCIVNIVIYRVYHGYRDMSWISWYIVNIVICREYRDLSWISSISWYIVTIVIDREYHDISWYIVSIVIYLVYRGYRGISCISWYIVNIAIYGKYRDVSWISWHIAYIMDIVICREYRDIFARRDNIRYIRLALGPLGPSRGPGPIWPGLLPRIAFLLPRSFRGLCATLSEILAILTFRFMQPYLLDAAVFAICGYIG